MRRRLGQALRVGVAEGALALAATSRWGAPQVLAELGYDPAATGSLSKALPQLLGGEHAGWPVSFVLADEMVRMWSVTPPQGAARMADLQAAASLRFHALFGEMPAAWAVGGDWDAVHPFIAAATPLALLAALEQAAGAHRMTVTGIEPHFVIAWNAWRKSLRPGAWFALVHADVLTLGVPRGPRLAAVRAAGVPDGAGVEWLLAHVGREALLLGLDAPQSLVMSGTVPDRWLGGSAQLSCALAGPAADPQRSAAVQLALAGVAQ